MTTAVIEKTHADNYGVRGARKMHAGLRRKGHRVARCTVERLMRSAGLRGISRAKGPRTTVPGTGPDALGDGHLDPPARRPGGRRPGASLGQGQYLAVRYTQRLAEAGAVASVGSTGDSYDNALAQAFNSLFKAELVRNRGPWNGIDDLEFATPDGGTSHEVGERRLIRPPTPARRDRPRSTGRARRALLPAHHRGDYRRRVSSGPPLNPGRDSPPGSMRPLGSATIRTSGI